MANVGDQLAVEARKYLGYPYVWATHGPNSFDCSGFTHWVVLQVTGDYISPGTDAQQYLGTLVPAGAANLRPGDFLFYAEGGVITHVGLYVGDGRMIHAANESTGVIDSDPFGPWYAERYVFARRLYPYDDAQAPGSEPEPHVIGQGDTAAPFAVFYDQPAAGANVSIVEAGATICVTGPAVDVSGFTFLPVSHPNGATGFVLADTLTLVEIGGCTGTAPDPEPEPEPEPSDPAPRTPAAWTAGDTIRVVDDPLNVRSSYPSGSILGTLATGEELCMVGGPAAANGYTWIQLEGRLNGWVAGEFCERAGIQTCAAPDPEPEPEPEPEPGPTWTHQVTGMALNFRTAPGGSLIATLPIGTRLAILGGPVASGGNQWYNVTAEGYGDGWCVNGFDPI